MSFLGSLVSAGTSILGGLMGNSAQKDANARAEHQAQLNRDMQLRFAQEGIRWKVEDAKAAGIHPLYALGANTTSFSPVSVGSGNPSMSLASGVASAGQDLSRALHATRTGSERDAAVLQTGLQLENAGLQNELLRTQIMKMKSQIGPAMPDIDTKKDGVVPATSDTRGLQLIEGQPPVLTPRKEASQEKVSDEYGDEGLASLPGQVRIARDWMKSHGYEFSPAGVARAVSDGWINWNSMLARSVLDVYHGRPFGRR